MQHSLHKNVDSIMHASEDKKSVTCLSNVIVLSRFIKIILKAMVKT